MRYKVVLLGSSGFLGRELMRALEGRGDVDVKGYGSAALDLTLPGSVDRLGEALGAETILISAVRPRPTEDPLESFMRDVAISANVARCLSRRRIRKLVHLSTVSVYNGEETNLSVTEETPVNPSSLYGIARLAGEALLRDCAGRARTPTAILRPCKFYGPGDVSGTYGPARFIESILRERRVRIYGDGGELRDLLFVEDLARVAIRFAFGEGEGTYNVATGESHSFGEILDCLREVFGEDFSILREERSGPRTDQGFDPSKLMAALPGFRFTSLEEGLRRTFEDFSERLSGGGRE